MGKKLNDRIKVLISDYDQTFYLNDDDIEINKEAIESFRKNGNIFIIATGRSYMDFKEKADLYNIKYDYLILDHGATILDNNDIIIDNYSINNKIIENIKEDLHIQKTIKNFCCSQLDSRVDFSHKNLTKIYCKYFTREEAFKISKVINDNYNEFVVAYNVPINAVEIISNKTNKSNAIKVLASKLNIPSKNIYTIGDGYSDIQMIKDFNGFAMVDCVDELKSICNHRYKSVSELIKDLNKI